MPLAGKAESLAPVSHLPDLVVAFRRLVEARCVSSGVGVGAVWIGVARVVGHSP